jgi:hypothetical protein
MPLKNAAAYVASCALIAGLTRHRVQLDQKKVAQLPPLRTTLVAPDPEDPTSTLLEPYRLWSFVLKKAHDSWMRDRPVPQDTTGGGVCRWGSEQKDMPTVVGGDCAGVSPGPLLH